MQTSHSPPARLTVAIAEDDDEQREALALALEGEGFEVIALEDGFELLDFLTLQRRHPADAIVSDLNMPGRPGIEGLEAARRRGLRTPIFVVSGSDDPQIRARVEQLGNALFFPKPIDPDRLARAIYELTAVSSASG